VIESTDTGTIRRVLLVEDDEGLVRLITRRLTRQGYQVDASRDAGAAIQSASEAVYDLLVLDYQLPDMNGQDLIRELGSQGIKTDFVVITGHGDERIAVEIMKQGARDYLVKDGSLLDRLPSAVGQVFRQIEIERRLRAIEHQLKLSERNAQALLDATSDGAMLLDPRGFVLATNAILADRLERPIAELIGSHISSCLAPVLSALLEERIGEAVGKRSTLRFEHLEEGRNLDIGLFPVLEAGSVLAVAVYVRDVTDQRKLEDQLRQSQKMEAIGQLAGGIAHDFNNILQVIIGAASLISDSIGGDDTEIGRDLREICDSANRGAQLTQRLLATSRRQIGQDQDVEVNPLIERLVSMVARVIGEGIQLRFLAGTGLCVVRADPEQIEQALLNLCINARDAMPDGGSLTLETKEVVLDEEFCSAHEGATPGRYSQISVSDTGHGMSREVLEHIYEPFFTTKPVGRGTGLGLASVYGIVKRNRGTLRVYSEVGHGTVFTVLLPCIDGEVAPADAGLDRSVRAKPRDGGETILVIEDDNAIRRLARRTLETRGYRVLEAANGDDAVASFKADPGAVSLIVSDVVLPGLAGKALEDELLAIDPNVPIIFTSGYSSMPGHAALGGDQGHPILQKPYSPRDLARQVRKVLDGRRQPAKGNQDGE
jgi:signal transduction histidine kinase